MLVSSVPLSLTIVLGLPCRVMIAVSSRVTRRPEGDVSATSAKHLRLKSSTMASTRNRRPSMKASDTKCRLQRSLGLSGTSICLRVPRHDCDRHAFGLAASRHDRAAVASSGSPTSPVFPTSHAPADSRTGAVQQPPPSSLGVDWHHPGARCHTAHSTDHRQEQHTLATGSPHAPHNGEPQLVAWSRALPPTRREILQHSVSSSRSADGLFSFAFSSSSVFSFRALDTSTPPNFAFHL